MVKCYICLFFNFFIRNKVLNKKIEKIKSNIINYKEQPSNMLTIKDDIETRFPYNTYHYDDIHTVQLRVNWLPPLFTFPRHVRTVIFAVPFETETVNFPKSVTSLIFCERFDTEIKEIPNHVDEIIFEDTLLSTLSCNLLKTKLPKSLIVRYSPLTEQHMKIPKNVLRDNSYECDEIVYYLPEENASNDNCVDNINDTDFTVENDNDIIDNTKSQSTYSDLTTNCKHISTNLNNRILVFR